MTKYRIYQGDHSKWDKYNEKWVKYYTLEELKEDNFADSVSSLIVLLLFLIIAYMIGSAFHLIGGLICCAIFVPIVLYVMYLHGVFFIGEKWIPANCGDFKTKKGAERYVKRIGELVKESDEK